MRILLIANYLSDAQESMQRFSNLLESGLQRLGHEVRIARPSPVLVRSALKTLPGAIKWLGYIDKFVLFPPVLKSAADWSDIVHICDHSNSLYVRSLQKHPHLVTCHDMLAVRGAMGELPGNSQRPSGRLLQHLIVNGLTRAQHIACVSRATRGDLLRVSGVPKNRTSLISNGPNYPFSRMAEAEAAERIENLNLPSGRPFLLHVGGNQWYKNRIGLLRIFARVRQFAPALDLNLITVGKPWTAGMRQFAVENNLLASVTELVSVSEEDLRALYSEAKLMLFPSLHEGFGWPIIEAQACGCPVITSNRPPMTEIGGDSAVYIDPENIESAARTVVAGLQRLASMRETGLRNAARFSASAMLESYLSLYHRLIAEKCSQVKILAVAEKRIAS